MSLLGERREHRSSSGAGAEVAGEVRLIFYFDAVPGSRPFSENLRIPPLIIRKHFFVSIYQCHFFCLNS